MSIASCEEHDIAVFVVPKGNTLPLHDHPGMTVKQAVAWLFRSDFFDHADGHEGFLFYSRLRSRKLLTTRGSYLHPRGTYTNSEHLATVSFSTF